MVILHKYNKRCKDQRFLRAMAVQYAEIFHILKNGKKKEEKKKRKKKEKKKKKVEHSHKTTASLKSFGQMKNTELYKYIHTIM